MAMLTYREMQDQLETAHAQNERLTEALHSARSEMLRMKADLAQVAEPPNTYAVFLGPVGRTMADVWVNGRKMRVAASKSVEIGSLRRGQEVVLSENLAVIEAGTAATTGQVVQVVDVTTDSRAVVRVHADDERLFDLAAELRAAELHTGDLVLVDLRAALVLETVERSEIADLVLEQVPEASYDDIGGLGAQIETIRDAVELPFLHQDVYREHGLRPPKGVLLYGPPGNGKTMIAKAVAHELAVQVAHERGLDVDASLQRSFFLNVKGPELLNKYVGETERSLRQIFGRARERAEGGLPVIVFFDEMESLFRTRGTGVSSDMESTVVPQLLAELDGVEELDNVIVIGATNREDLIDPAILRPGRLDVKIRIDRPGETEAHEILGLYLDDSVPVRGASAGVLVDRAIRAIYAEDDSTRLVELAYSDGDVEILRFRDVISGAMLRNVADRAKKAAVKDLLRSGDRGVAPEHVDLAVDAEFRENEDLPATAHSDDWARITGRRGRRVESVRSLLGVAGDATEEGAP